MIKIEKIICFYVEKGNVTSKNDTIIILFYLISFIVWLNKLVRSEIMSLMSGCNKNLRI